MPFPRQGPTLNGVQTDCVTVLMADNAFLDVALSAVTDTSVDPSSPGTDLGDGPDRVTAGPADDDLEGLVQHPGAGHRGGHRRRAG